MSARFDLSVKLPPVSPDAAGGRTRCSFQTWMLPTPCNSTNHFYLYVLQNDQERCRGGKKNKVEAKKKCEVIVSCLSEKAVQEEGRSAKDGSPQGTPGCLNPSRAAGLAHPSQLRSPPRRTSHSARRRLNMRTLMLQLACRTQQPFWPYQQNLHILNCAEVLQLNSLKCTKFFKLSLNSFLAPQGGFRYTKKINIPHFNDKWTVRLNYTWKVRFMKLNDLKLPEKPRPLLF